MLFLHDTNLKFILFTAHLRQSVEVLKMNQPASSIKRHMTPPFRVTKILRPCPATSLVATSNQNGGSSSQFQQNRKQQPPLKGLIKINLICHSVFEIFLLTGLQLYLETWNLKNYEKSLEKPGIFNMFSSNILIWYKKSII